MHLHGPLRLLRIRHAAVQRRLVLVVVLVVVLVAPFLPRSGRCLPCTTETSIATQRAGLSGGVEDGGGAAGGR